MTLAGLTVVWGCGGSPESQSVTPRRPGAMRLPRLVHTQTGLPDGRVLIAGGLQSAEGLLPPANNDVEIFDPKTGKFKVVAQMKTVRGAHTATLLADGRVVFIGGTPGTKVDIFNPRTCRMESGGDVMASRGAHTATLLPDGRILLVGGMRHAVTYHSGDLHREWRYLKSIELYDVRTKSSRALGVTLKVPRRGHTATLLGDGRVLVIGGTWATRTEVIDVAAGTVTWGPPLGTAREDHRTTKLADARLLITGGTAAVGNARSLDVAEVFDPKENRFRTLPARMIRRREDHTADLLPDGRVLITGGEDNQAGPKGRDIVLDDVELYDPKTETFAKLPPLSVPRDDHCSALLPDARVLITGGEDENDRGLRSAEFVVVRQKE
ncbi:MAG: hypothetical protein AMS16_03625 [Planctomycetes bacterium DG_58]|nr:MAG: hypothetical protein AMS16_03625 [Planctomycetes bacterium DG_58]